MVSIKILHKELPAYLKYINDHSPYGVTCLRAINSYTTSDGERRTYIPYTRYRNDINDLVSHAIKKTNYFITLNGLTKINQKGEMVYV